MNNEPDSSAHGSLTETNLHSPTVLHSSSWNYEATVAEVEGIIHRIEVGELPLAELFDQFSMAVERLRQCESFLTRQQQQVDLLIETLLDESELF